MKKTFIYGFVVFFTEFLFGCELFTQNPNSSYKTELGTRSGATAQKTKIVKGKDLKGAQFNAVDEQGRKLNFEIKDVELDPKDSEKKTYLYTVFYLDSADSQWKILCIPDAENVAKAIPLTGSWDETGKHTESSDIITFGCTSGVLAKCVRFGYKPWKNVKESPSETITKLARA